MPSRSDETFWWFWMRSLRTWLEEGCPAEPGTELALDLGPVPPDTWAVLTALASFANPDGTNIRPKYARIKKILMKPGGHGQEVVRGVVTRMTAVGFLVQVADSEWNGTAPGRPKLFRLAVPEWWQTEMRRRTNGYHRAQNRRQNGDRPQSPLPVDDTPNGDCPRLETVTARSHVPTDSPTDAGSGSAAPLQGGGAAPSPEPVAARVRAAKLAAVNGEFANRDLNDPHTAAEYRARLARVGITT